MSRCRFVLTNGERCGAPLSGLYCEWHQTCANQAIYIDAHRGPNPPDTPTTVEPGEAATGDTSAPVAADIAADYPWLASTCWTLRAVNGDEARQALAEIEEGRNAIAALRMLRQELRAKDREIARLEGELAAAKQHEAHWRKEADSWKESVDALTRQVDDIKNAIDTADTATAAAFATLKGYAL